MIHAFVLAHIVLHDMLLFCLVVLHCFATTFFSCCAAVRLTCDDVPIDGCFVDGFQSCGVSILVSCVCWGIEDCRVEVGAYVHSRSRMWE